MVFGFVLIFMFGWVFVLFHCLVWFGCLAGTPVTNVDKEQYKRLEFKSNFIVLEQQIESSKPPPFYRDIFCYFQQKVTCLTAPLVVRKCAKISEKQMCRIF